MSKSKILLLFDTDPQPSVFDGVVAVDAGVDQLFRHGGVQVDAVRRPGVRRDVHARRRRSENTAIFIGGTDVAAGEALLAKCSGRSSARCASR